MEIDQLLTVEDHEKGAKMNVNDQNGKKTDIILILAGMDSKVYRKAKTMLARELLKDPDGDTEEARARALSKCTLGWEGLTDKGKVVKFSEKKAMNLYIGAPYVMDQVDGFVIDRANFTKG